MLLHLLCFLPDLLLDKAVNIMLKRKREGERVRERGGRRGRAREEKGERKREGERGRREGK